MRQDFFNEQFTSSNDSQVKSEFERWNKIAKKEEKRVAANQLRFKSYFSVSIQNTTDHYSIALSQVTINLSFESEEIKSDCQAYMSYNKLTGAIASKDVTKIIGLFHYKEVREKLGAEYLFDYLTDFVDKDCLKKMMEGEITSPKMVLKHYLEKSIKIKVPIPIKKLQEILKKEIGENKKILINAIKTSQNPHYLIQEWENLTEKEKTLISETTYKAFILGKRINPSNFIKGEKKIKAISDKLAKKLNKISLSQMILDPLYPKMMVSRYNTKEVKILSSNIDFFHEGSRLDNCIFEENYFEKAKTGNFFYLSIRSKDLDAHVELQFEKTKQRLTVHQFSGFDNEKLPLDKFKIVEDYLDSNFTHFLRTKNLLKIKKPLVYLNFEIFTETLDYNGEFI